MSTIQKFEDLICWQKARELTNEIYGMFKNLKFKDFGLQDQLQRASVSIMSNIAEGFERGTKQELLNYLFIAKGSAGEVRAQLYVALDAGYLNIETFKYLNSLAVECSRLLQSFVTKVKISQFQGLQYKHEKRKGMSDINKMILDNSPGLKELYNAEKDEIEFWRQH
ncbi:MAG: hypothetical protein A2736_01265 [Candidatus Yanofskybacteria bacterium RIFCSPHIGHO2_01_FULL_41_27]|uniref:Four helix bundle protein n=2 Tax=Candidatus Yanofskyibacteriota TaxID=1752733 RepID=A0A1F8HP70_9BACT|nr:MAG: hypothetical protein A2736_01265 [Candidatus Yanofskybacteria bacterium RIFCSPHIGHO2_01_FULL_41_27]OGN10052.1 MAG: hypothetical protein A3C64_00280 [Candidatus Yanofskybacteria bacterium RIFCSPHIGHO2_02_FULL_41_12]OGN20822.1 MAG: hypothetical protein A3B00_01980 [Candidatus Yanofskybacteria bacterium RIFCSPLOWO2_01_FULL_41_33]OGN39272.1 MAG: hypothetical protein A2606_00225 [Candidatus Yanofskybacteria bacterium RIFOXYD1_FULL_42_10]